MSNDTIQPILTGTLISAAVAAARPGRRVPRSAGAWYGRVALRERIGDSLRPYMHGVWQWLIEPVPGESERQYARRAAVYAAQRVGITDAPPDAAILQSIASILRRA